MSRVSTILNGGADEMEKRGKARDAFINRRGNVCAMGAIRIACGGVPGDSCGVTVIFDGGLNWRLYHEAYRTLDNYLLEHKIYKTDKQKTDNVPGWNDRNNKETVVKVMRAAAKHADYIDSLKLVAHNSK